MTVLFGGDGLDPGTWEWDGRYWTQVSDMGPPLRRSAAMAWESSAKRLILFGGFPMPGLEAPDALGDTWEWDGANWTQLDDAGPAGRFAFGMAGDTSRAKVVLFGGNNFVGGAPQVLGDTWEWDGTAWTQIEETGPSARAGHCMAFDSVRGRTVLFGGNALGVTSLLGDTWEWSGTAWVQAAEFGPAARLVTAMSFDGTQSLIFGGTQTLTGVQSGMGDTWSWNGKFWTQRQDIGPPPRLNAAMAFDSARKKTVLFGGAGAAGSFGDTWELSERT